MNPLQNNPLIYNDENGDSKIVHDTHSSFFLAKKLAEDLADGRITVKDIYQQLDNQFEGLNEKYEGLKEGAISFFEFLFGLVDEKDKFVLELNELDKDLAAICVNLHLGLENSTINSVVNSYMDTIKGFKSYEKKGWRMTKIIKSLGNMKCRSAMATLSSMDFETHEYEMTEAYAKCGDYRDLEFLVDKMMDVTFKDKKPSKRRENYGVPPKKVLEYLRDYANPTLISNVLCDKFYRGILHRYFLFSENQPVLTFEDANRIVSDVRNFDFESKAHHNFYRKKLDPILRYFSDWVYESSVNTTEETSSKPDLSIPHFDPEVHPHGREVLQLLASKITPLNLKLLLDSFYEREEKKKNHILDYIGDILPYLNRSSIDVLINDQRKRLETVELDGKEYNIGQVYSEIVEGEEKHFFYFYGKNVNDFFILLTSIFQEELSSSFEQKPKQGKGNFRMVNTKTSEYALNNGRFLDFLHDCGSIFNQVHLFRLESVLDVSREEMEELAYRDISSNYHFLNCESIYTINRLEKIRAQLKNE